MPQRIVAILVMPLVATACSSSTSAEVETAEDIELLDGQAACLVEYGDYPDQAIGPIRRNDRAVVELSEDSKAIIGNGKGTLHISVYRGRAQAITNVNWDEVPASGYVMEDIWINSAHPGYRITCRRR